MTSSQSTQLTENQVWTPMSVFQERLKNLRLHFMKAKREDKEHPGHFFVPLSEIERILSESVLNALFSSWVPRPGQKSGSEATKRLLERQPRDELGAYRFLRVFATLVYTGKDEYIKRATDYFLDPEPSKWIPPEDDSSPWSDENAEHAFYNNDNVLYKRATRTSERRAPPTLLTFSSVQLYHNI
jgi:hypothetical protein